MKGPEKTDREAASSEIAKAVTIILNDSPESATEELAGLLSRMPSIVRKVEGETVIDLNALGRR